MASSMLRKLLRTSTRTARPARRPRLEALEDRMVPAIVWTNKGNDDFGAFGAKATAARAVVQAAIDDWNRVIVDNKLVDGKLNLKVEMESLADGTWGIGDNVLTINNRPYKGRIRLNTKLVDTYFVDPTPHDHGEFQGTILSPYAALASAPEAVGRPDLYSLVVHEIGHIVGMTTNGNSELKQLVQDGERNGVKLINTGMKDPFGAGNLFLGQGPSGTIVLSGTNLGKESDPFHVARAQDVAYQFGTYYATADVMNFTSSLNGQSGGQRRLISNQVVSFLKDLYGFGVKTPSEQDSFFAVYDNDKQELTVRGIRDRYDSNLNKTDVISNDKITVHATASAITVTVFVDTNYFGDAIPGAPGHGFAGRTFTRTFQTNGKPPVVRSLRIFADDGNDNVSVTGTWNDVLSVDVRGGVGDDTISVKATMPDAAPFLIRGEDGNDKITVSGTLSGQQPMAEVRGGNGNDVIDLKGVKGTGFSVLGGDGNDIIDGSGQRDFLHGEDDNDTIRGNGGSDVLYGEHGRDTLRGGDGNDEVYGGHFFNPNGDASADEVFGDSGNDILFGDNGVVLGPNSIVAYASGGIDKLRGGSGNDQMYGGGGKDLLIGDDGADSLYGGAGDDEIVGGFVFATNIIANEPSADKLFGEAGNDYLWGDTITSNPYSVPPGGSGGADSLSGGTGNDHLYGQANNDQLAGDDGNDVLEGGDGNDKLIGDFVWAKAGDKVGTGADTLRGGNGNDVLLGDNGQVSPTLVMNETDGGKDVLEGQAGNDRLYGQAKGDRLIGGYGSDTLDGGLDADQMVGGIILVGNAIPDGSADTMDGDDGNDWMAGDNVNAQFQTVELALAGGKDIILGGRGNDTMFGQAGGDEMGGGQGADTIKGGAGNDILVGGLLLPTVVRIRDLSDDTLDGGSGDDQLYGDNVFNPLKADAFEQGGNDKLNGGEGVDLLFGQAGNDLMLGGYGDDKLFGGYGDDKMAGGIIQGLALGDSGKDTLDGQEGNDMLCGDNVTNTYAPVNGITTGGNDVIKGGKGDDVLYGQAGNDVLIPGDGDDEVFDGPGDDTIVDDDFTI